MASSLENPHEIRIISKMISYGFNSLKPYQIYTRWNQIQIYLVQIYSLNNRDLDGYIKERSALPPGTSSKSYPIACIRRTPKFLFGGALLVHNHLSHKLPTFHLGTSNYAGSPKPFE
ncbi:hypothetical protein PIB30_083082, partial [Stylosanthes scabra]|nr:hypothetical protein [Stylosanthes scabra]